MRWLDPEVRRETERPGLPPLQDKGQEATRLQLENEVGGVFPFLGKGLRESQSWSFATYPQPSLLQAFWFEAKSAGSGFREL